MMDISTYDMVLFDGFGTIYDQEYNAILNAHEIFSLLEQDTLLVSNVGSISGQQLNGKIASSFGALPNKTVTSLDLLLQYCNYNSIGAVYHFGGAAAASKFKSYGLQLVEYDDAPDVIVFTSLPGENWIRKSQEVLKLIQTGNVKKLILGNPDRMIRGTHIGINIGMVFDMLIRDWVNEGEMLPIVEIGKPNISRADLDLSAAAKLLVVGDNIKTDGKLASNLNADFAHISADGSNSALDLNGYFSFSNIGDFINNVRNS